MRSTVFVFAVSISPFCLPNSLKCSFVIQNDYNEFFQQWLKSLVYVECKMQDGFEYPNATMWKSMKKSSKCCDLLSFTLFPDMSVSINIHFDRNILIWITNPEFWSFDVDLGFIFDIWAAASTMQDFCKCREVGVRSRKGLKVWQEDRYSGLCFTQSSILSFFLFKHGCWAPF